MANGLFGGGDGTAGFPFLVEDAEDLNAVRNSLNKYYKQVADIDLLSWGHFDTIGSVASAFTGEYNGSGFSVKNLTQNKTNIFRSGLFAVLSGRVLNLGLVDVNILGGDYTGGIAGSVNAGPNSIPRMQNCFVTGSIAGSVRVGGLVGNRDEEGFVAKDCYVNCVVRGASRVGGIVGYSLVASNVVAFDSCYSAGEVHGSATTGGFVGGADGSFAIKNCYSLVDSVTRTSGAATSFGKFSGVANSLLNNCFSLSSMVFRG